MRSERKVRCQLSLYTSQEFSAVLEIALVFLPCETDGTFSYVLGVKGKTNPSNWKNWVLGVSHVASRHFSFSIIFFFYQ